MACPAGQAGSIVQTRTASCTAGSWVYGAWTMTSNTCAAPAAPLCRINADTGALSVSALPAAIQCVQRLDNMAQQRVVDGRAFFATPRAAEGTGLYTFSAVNVYGACTDKVAQLVCSSTPK